MVKWKIIASAGSVDALELMIQTFWSSTAYTINRLSLEIEHPDRTPPTGTRVRKLGGRYRFERES